MQGQAFLVSVCRHYSVAILKSHIALEFIKSDGVAYFRVGKTDKHSYTLYRVVVYSNRLEKK